MRSVPKSLLWAWAVATAALYGVLAYGSYVTLPFLARGILGFDMRPFGMPFDIAEPYIVNLTSDAQGYYFGVLRPLDTAFIVALVLLAVALAQRFGGKLFWLSLCAAFLYGAADFVENWLVGLAMGDGFHLIAPEAFEKIAQFTKLKFAALVLMAASLLLQWRRADAQR
ncbi:hypothetical protein BDE40_3011 [Litoreibacter halocynthiae]|uniref:Uncharacterized protein n=1 Tax=Litoreibacter halocynthiae TaxID=1242689 RepID=A0A4R7LEZ2_9RHOB|nr:hypothetical protein [Litoreibacter halocynthiae]TDT74223.1 hypothetical protein BDE40_3011 [Litoreibacter halocynthiae]